MTKDFILASGSVHRKGLLAQIGYLPKLIEPADIDESERKGEKPAAYVKRMALEKGLAAAAKHPGEVVLACDTVVTIGTRIFHKARNEAEQTEIMKALSGKTNRVLSAVCVVDRNGKAVVKLNQTKVMMKHLSPDEIRDYVASQEWVGCSGYKIDGVLGAFVYKMVGSYSGVVGLPLYETRNLLISAGVK